MLQIYFKCSNSCDVINSGVLTPSDSIALYIQNVSRQMKVDHETAISLTRYNNWVRCLWKHKGKNADHTSAIPEQIDVSTAAEGEGTRPGAPK